jgi:FtsP/CotA-like multicopper oxidase with cupredoxin domain
LSAAIAVPVLFAGAWFAQARTSGGVVRTYYIAADEVEWDYAPTGKNQITGADFSEAEKQFIEPGPQRMGRKALKAVYHEYTDSTFTTLKPRAPEWDHLGMLGPLVRAEVGDTIKIVFRNNAHFPASLHPHGVFYNKDSEGAPYSDNSKCADKADDGVPHGGTHVYTLGRAGARGPHGARSQHGVLDVPLACG